MDLFAPTHLLVLLLVILVIFGRQGVDDVEGRTRPARECSGEISAGFRHGVPRPPS